MLASALASAEAARPAGGAPLWQLVALFGVYIGGTAAVTLLVQAHRFGRTTLLARAGAFTGRIFGVPGWAALPVTVGIVGLLTAMWGGVWDIGYHIDNGRDEGPLGNPGHWPLLFGIFTTFAAGILCVGMAEQKHATPAWVRIAPGWRVPLGGALLLACMAFALVTLGLDDVWHRIFGQDVTLWSPTHFVFLFGGILTVSGMLVLLREGSIARQAERASAVRPGDAPRARSGGPWMGAWLRLQRVALLGGLLCGLELFLTEFDYGVPLYRQVWQPLLLAAFSGFIYSAARAWAGPGAALGAWVVYAAIRLTAVVIPAIAGVSPSSMPLLLAGAVCVEFAALALDPRRRPIAFGAAAGLACGTVGFAAEYGWSQFAMPLPWTEALLPEGLILAAMAGLSGGLLGRLFAGALRGALPPRRVARVACVGAFAVIVGCAVDASLKRVPDARAHVELTDVRAAPQREALATVRFDPPDAAEGANWIYMLGWAGGEPRVADRLERVERGVYRSTRPIPLHGTWKVGLRLNRGYERGAVPIRLPVDRGLPNAEARLPAVATEAELERALRGSSGAELPAPRSFTRPFGDDGLIVLREAKDGVSGWLWGAAIGSTFFVWGLFIVGLTLGLGRLGRRTPATPATPARPVAS